MTCNCHPNPTAIGTCGCPVHGMDALRALLREAQMNLTKAGVESDLPDRITVALDRPNLERSVGEHVAASRDARERAGEEREKMRAMRFD